MIHRCHAGARSVFQPLWHALDARHCSISALLVVTLFMTTKMMRQALPVALADSMAIWSACFVAVSKKSAETPPDSNDLGKSPDNANFTASRPCIVVNMYLLEAFTVDAPFQAYTQHVRLLQLSYTISWPFVGQ